MKEMCLVPDEVPAVMSNGRDFSHYYVDHANIASLYVFPSVLTTISVLILTSLGISIKSWMVLSLFASYYLVGLGIVALASHYPLIAIGYASIASYGVHITLVRVLYGDFCLSSSPLIAVVGGLLALYLARVL